MTEATVQIATVIARAEKITAADMRVTDRVFSTHGESHALRAVWRQGRYVLFRRADVTHADSILATDTITVMRAVS